MNIQYLRTDLLTRNRLEARVVRVKSPHLFWIQLRNSVRDLQDLEEELRFRMDRKSSYLHVFPDAMKPNLDVSIKHNDTWKREFIKSVNKDTWTVKIILRDWGRVVCRHMNEIYILEDRFKELPWQAFICGLAYTEPINKAKIWPQQTREFCRVMFEGYKGWINIVRSLREGAVLIKLLIHTKNEANPAYNVRDALVQMGHAKISTCAVVDAYQYKNFLLYIYTYINNPLYLRLKLTFYFSFIKKKEREREQKFFLN